MRGGVLVRWSNSVGRRHAQCFSKMSDRALSDIRANPKVLRRKPLEFPRRFSNPRLLPRFVSWSKIGRFRWVCHPGAPVRDRALAPQPPLLPSVLPAGAQGFLVGPAEPLRDRRAPFLLRGFVDPFAQRRRGRDPCFSCCRSFPLRLPKTRPLDRYLQPVSAALNGGHRSLQRGCYRMDGQAAFDQGLEALVLFRRPNIIGVLRQGSYFPFAFSPSFKSRSLHIQQGRPPRNTRECTGPSGQS